MIILSLRRKKDRISPFYDIKIKAIPKFCGMAFIVFFYSIQKKL